MWVLECCLTAVLEWMKVNRLKLNPGEMKVMWLGDPPERLGVSSLSWKVLSFLLGIVHIRNWMCFWTQLYIWNIRYWLHPDLGRSTTVSLSCASTWMVSPCQCWYMHWWFPRLINVILSVWGFPWSWPRDCCGCRVWQPDWCFGSPPLDPCCFLSQI